MLFERRNLSQTKVKKNIIKKNEVSPLTKLVGCDPVRHVVLEPMHLFDKGICERISNEHVNKSSPNKLSSKQRSELDELLNGLRIGIPLNFQRKCFALKDIAHWKCTQLHFVLVYALPLLLKRFVTTKNYKHLLLLFVGSRILFSNELAVPYLMYAKELLRNFFSLLPSMYGKDTQVINSHNIIHVADDVEYMRAPLSNFSAYPFENYLGHIKKLVRSPNSASV